MALVLVLAGLFVYLRTSSELTGVLDDGLEPASRTCEPWSPPIAEPKLTGERLFEGEEGFSQVLAPDGDGPGLELGAGLGAAVEPRDARAGGARAALIDETEVPGIEGEARCSRRPADSPEGQVIVVAGSSTEDRRETLAGIAGAFLIGAPLALALAGGLGFLLATARSAPVEAHAPPGGGDHARSRRRAAPAAAGRRRDPPPRPRR